MKTNQKRYQVVLDGKVIYESNRIDHAKGAMGKNSGSTMVDMVADVNRVALAVERKVSKPGVKKGTDHSKFAKGSGKYACRVCGKETRETGEGESGIQLCAVCYNEVGLENEHSDGGHAEFNPDCPTCRAERGISAPVAGGKKAHDNGDGVAAHLRGMSIDRIASLASRMFQCSKKLLNVETGRPCMTLTKQAADACAITHAIERAHGCGTYKGKANPGSARMSLGLMIRKYRKFGAALA